MKTKSIVAGLLLIVLVGCSDIQKGYVYDKQYYTAWTQIIGGYTTEECEKVGQSEDCYPIFHPPVLIYHPALWELDISSCDGKQSDSCQQNAMVVSQDTYEKDQVGDYVDLSGS